MPKAKPILLNPLHFISQLKPLLASILRRWVSTLSRENLVNENSETERNRNHRKTEEARHASPVTRTIVEVPDSVFQEYRCAQKKQKADNRKTRHISLAAVLIAGGIAGIGIWQAILTRRANNTLQQQLTLSERPWVSIDLDTLQVINPLTFNEKGGFITVFGKMRNTGHSVAIHTLSDIYVMDATQLSVKAQWNQRQMCAAPRNLDQTVGYNMFPNDTAPITAGAEFYPKDISYALSHAIIHGRVMPMVLICIQYQSVCEKRYHLTQYLFNAVTPEGIGAFVPQGTINNLLLNHTFFGDLAY